MNKLLLPLFVAVLNALALGAPALVAPAWAVETEDRGPPREPAVGQTLAPRPGAAIRDTVGAAPPPAVAAPSPVRDDRLIIEERPASVSSPPCAAGVARADCPR